METAALEFAFPYPLWLIPVIGWIVMIVFLVQEGEAGDNRFGNVPLN